MRKTAAPRPAVQTARSKAAPRSNWDGGWKEVLGFLLRQCLLLLAPALHDAVDCSQEPVPLDAELRAITRRSRTGRGTVDRLFKVRLKSGEEVWLLIHIEVQNQVDPGFGKRMFRYHYRIFDRWEMAVVSLAILGDDDPHWRPSSFEYQHFGCRLRLDYPVVKLLDFRERIEELEHSTNPFALVILAHLRTMETARQPNQRLQWKLHLAKMMYDRGYGSAELECLYRFLDWVMVLPERIDRQYLLEVERFEKERMMPFVTTAERIGRKDGALEQARESVLTVLESRFQETPESVAQRVGEMKNLKRLRELLRRAAVVATLEEFQHELS